jgi:hypothetical protein
VETRSCDKDPSVLVALKIAIIFNVLRYLVASGGRLVRGGAFLGGLSRLGKGGS